MRGLAALGLLFLWSCSSSRPIRQLLDHAFQFDARTVRIVGEVKALQALGSDAPGLGVYERGDALPQQAVVVDEDQGDRLALNGHAADSLKVLIAREPTDGSESSLLVR